MDSILQKLRNLDAYPKINDDFFSRTLSGGIITLASSLLILLLFFSELSMQPFFTFSVYQLSLSLPCLFFAFLIILRCGESLEIVAFGLCRIASVIYIYGLYLHTVTESKLLVDASRGETLHINFDVTFPAIRCSLLSLDTMDISGEQHFDIRHDIVKKRIDAHGHVIEAKKDGIGAPKIENPLQRHGGRLEHNEKYCGSCFGAEMSDDDCCNSCDEVRDAYRKKGWALTNADLIDQCKREGFIQKIKDEDGEGCNIEGSLEVNKVAGNFHFVSGKSFHQSNVHVHDLLVFQTDGYNISHKINKLAFGDYFPGVLNPLDGVQWMQETPNGMYQYFIKVVPTLYTNIKGRTIRSNQYSVTEHFKSSELGRSQLLPGVFFFYDLSPIKVTLKEEHAPFLHFMTHICAIIGGIFTVAGLIDSFVYHGQRAMKKKMEIGKFG